MLPAAIHQVITASASAHHLVDLARPYAQSTFKDEVAKYLNEHGINYMAGEVVKGKSREHRFDFMVQKKDNRIVGMRALSATQPSYATHLAVYSAFAYNDVKLAGIPLFALFLLDTRFPTFGRKKC